MVGYSDVNETGLAQSIGCTQMLSGQTSCTPTTPNINILPTAGVFGDFLDALHTLYQMAAGAFLPYYLVIAYLGQGAVGIATIIQTAFLFMYGGLIIYVVGNRDPEGIY